MPQMEPINWLILFLYFSMILIMFNIFNYYNLYPMIPKYKFNTLKYKSMNWKW
uniref:ATP synthase complex subunit 8 n=1 Tax=Chloroniella peringueyi TaxID=1569772 RepID=A0A8K1WBJ7_9NEOP|nr:ATP synthase F0 subunit 8 [Chloroniella peringueyi]